jgi:hypothetical protein
MACLCMEPACMLMAHAQHGSLLSSAAHAHGLTRQFGCKALPQQRCMIAIAIACRPQGEFAAGHLHHQLLCCALNDLSIFDACTPMHPCTQVSQQGMHEHSTVHRVTERCISIVQLHRGNRQSKCQEQLHLQYGLQYILRTVG